MKRPMEEMAGRIIGQVRQGLAVDPRLAFVLAYGFLERDPATALALDVILGVPTRTSTLPSSRRRY